MNDSLHVGRDAFRASKLSNSLGRFTNGQVRRACLAVLCLAIGSQSEPLLGGLVRFCLVMFKKAFDFYGFPIIAIHLDRFRQGIPEYIDPRSNRQGLLASAGHFLPVRSSEIRGYRPISTELKANSPKVIPALTSKVSNPILYPLKRAGCILAENKFPRQR